MKLRNLFQTFRHPEHESSCHASELEAQLLKLGANPMYQGFNGASEFRALTDIELREAIDLISKYRINFD